MKLDAFEARRAMRADISTIATTGTPVITVVRQLAESGLLEEIARQDPRVGVVFRDALYRAAEAALTEETTDAAIDALDGVKWPKLVPGFIVKRVLDALLPGGLLKLLRWIIYAPTWDKP